MKTLMVFRFSRKYIFLDDNKKEEIYFIKISVAIIK